MEQTNTAAAGRRKLRIWTARDLDKIPALQSLPQERRDAIRAVAAVLPFRVNEYVVEELIDWDKLPDDPMFQLAFPQQGMLAPHDFNHMLRLLRIDAPAAELTAAAREIQHSMNPHPAGQLELNVPRLDGAPVPGLQHKYRETVLCFPSPGQTCHTYCTYCFRWAQFVGIDELKFAAREADSLVAYLRQHPEVTNVLFTGGDPMVMKTRVLRRYIEPLLQPGFEHIEAIRIGTKSPAFWPYRFVTDTDADDLLRLFEDVGAAGKHLALMAHYSHPRELSTPIAESAIRRIQSTGAVVRSQAPLIRHVNDDAASWRAMWRKQTQLGIVPYYMFVERDTGPKRYFEVPLARALEIFNEALRSVSGLGRTVRGPSMSATPGKVVVDGVAEIGGERVFVLKMLQARTPAWVGRTFFARFDPSATWLDDLEPFGDESFFFERAVKSAARGALSLVGAEA